MRSLCRVEKIRVFTDTKGLLVERQFAKKACVYMDITGMPIRGSSYI